MHGALAPLFVAGFFGTFLLYLALGLLALAATAALDKAMGKERGLLLYAAVLVGLTWLMRPVAPPPTKPMTKALKFEDARARLDPSTVLEFRGEVFSRPPVPEASRNVFQEHSDTNPLPPVALEKPPPVSLAFPLPPTIPGVAPGARWRYRGTVPDVKTGDGSKLPDVPPDAFTAYERKPEDVFDWIEYGGRRTYVYVLAIDGMKEGSPEFESPRGGLKWALASGEGAQLKPWKDLLVTFVVIGDEAKAKSALTDVRKAKKGAVGSPRAPLSPVGGEPEKWTLRRTVENLYVESLRKNGRGNVDPASLEVEELKAVAADMARVGDAGKEDGAGWDKAAAILQVALQKERARPQPDLGEILASLVEAYRARQDERSILATLSEYDRVNPRRGDGPAWLGEVYLERLRLADAGDGYFGEALRREPGLRSALVGRGDAAAARGLHDEALRYLQEASARAGADVSVRLGEEYLRLGRLPEARTALEAALSVDAFDPRVLILKGAIQYANGEVQPARDTFAQAAALPGDGPSGMPARRHRAEALYDLGLAEWRLGHGDAASAAFDAAEAALRAGAQRGRSPDETVSPELGRALLSLAATNLSEASDSLERSRAEAPGVAYVEMLDGWMAANRRDWAAAKPLFERALALASDLREVDGWMSETRLHLAEDATAKGGPPAESAADFDAAVKFAERASRRETDPKARLDFLVREAHVKMRWQNQSERKRFEAAVEAAKRALALAREERRALAVKGYCEYMLGVQDSDHYVASLRDFDDLLRVNAPPDDPLTVYAKACEEAIKHWQRLEEKVITFSDTKLTTDWKVDEANGIRATPDKGRLRFFETKRDEGAKKDGALNDPTVHAFTASLFNKDSFESVRMLVWIPKTDKGGENVNNVLFEIAVQGDSRGKPTERLPGVAVAWYKGKVHVRVGGGTDPLFKSGEFRDPAAGEMPWPEDAGGLPTRVEIERLDKDGNFEIRLNGTVVLKDRVPVFKQAKGPAELYLGGFSTQTQRWDVSVDDVRVVRRKP